MFVAHCILNQNARAEGNAINGLGTEILELLSAKNIGIVQLPCPALNWNCSACRKPKTKDAHDTASYRKFCRTIASDIMNQIERWRAAECAVLGIIGIERSPHCAVYQIENGRRVHSGKGIFIEELENEMAERRMQVPILGANPGNSYDTIDRLNSLITHC